ncbi:hypothetical protein TKK_0003686 [Trichogramma kaykai]|uniref:Major facilitator superfamily (MFS) profile domain-containing protein n=1 Tax=Trichogramma kaykai TaxID=54128 RepID=A0ABD2XMP5_9HYME
MNKEIFANGIATIDLRAEKCAEDQEPSQPTKSYDEAIRATGWGWYNVHLLLLCLPIAWSAVIDTTSTVFVLNSQECEFELTMFRRGIALCVIYMGMIVAGPIWDTCLREYSTAYLGKRNIIIIGILMDALCNLFWTYTSSFYTYVICKFISGLIVAGPLSVVMAYLSEFHAITYQVKFTRWAGLLVAVSNIVPAALAATLLHRADWLNFTLHAQFYPTWRIYLLINGLPSILGVITACLLPKSPKFLIAQGKREDALRILAKMYRWNHRDSNCEYPITNLKHQEAKKRPIGELFADNFQRYKSVFSAPYSHALITVLFLQFFAMMGFHVTRLWVPPLYVTMNHFRVLTRHLYPKDELITMCEMLYPRMQNIDHTGCTYVQPKVEAAVYVNSTIIATTAVILGFVFVLLATTRLRKISLLVFLFLVAAAGCCVTNWAINIPWMLVTVALTIVGSRVAGQLIVAYNSEILPLHLRSTSLSVINFVGNLGAVVGNVIFGILIDIDCSSTFLCLGVCLFLCTIMPVFLVQKVKKMDLDVVEATRF